MILMISKKVHIFTEKLRKLKKKKKSTKTGHVEAEKKLNNYITLYAKLINDLSE